MFQAKNSTRQSELSAKEINYTVRQKLPRKKYLHKEGQVADPTPELEPGFITNSCLGGRGWQRAFLIDAVTFHLGVALVPTTQLGHLRAM